MTKDDNPRFLHGISSLLLSATVVGIALFVLAGPLYRVGWIELGPAFSMLGWSFRVALATAGLALLGLIAGAIGFGRGLRRRFAIALVLPGLVAGGLYLLYSDARSYVPIHDVTTDLADPPQFVALDAGREDMRPVPDRGRADLAKMPPEDRWRTYHKEAYGDLEPLIVKGDIASVTEIAADVARAMGWEIAAVDPAAGRLEATDTTSWFGFKDDIVVRIRAKDADSVRVNMRSVSRIGVSDIGANAKRIRRFLARLAARTGA
ncbi:MAG: DUF1499 domain-containing protein [Rhodothalassiaceae bacterium]